MDPKQNFKGDALDIIFENRNKAYGAYELRKNYRVRARRALTLAATGALLVLSLHLVAAWSGDKATRVRPPVYDTITISHIPDRVPPPKPKPQPRVRTTDVSTYRATVYRIVPVDSVPDSETHKPPQAVAGLNDHIGKPPSDPNPPVLPPGKDPIPPVVPPILDPVTPMDVSSVEQMPEFPGGEDALLEYLGSNIHYPKPAVENNTEGKVVIEFVIDPTGSIADMRVKRSIGFGCDEEALRVVGSMPKWKPGRNNGKPVPVLFSLPIVFQLEGQ